MVIWLLGQGSPRTFLFIVNPLKVAGLPMSTARSGMILCADLERFYMVIKTHRWSKRLKIKESGAGYLINQVLLWSSLLKNLSVKSTLPIGQYLLKMVQILHLGPFVYRESRVGENMIKARGAYHGVDAWCDPGLGGRISSDRSHVLEFEWNDFEELESLFKQYSGKIASVILTPYHHPSFAPSVLPDPSFWGSVENLCRTHETALILDDVRCGWRLDESGSHNYFGFTPDLAVYSKALGNGYAISACVGTEKFRDGASDVFLTGSSWNDAYAMAASLASLKLSTENKVASSVLTKGKFFCAELEKLANQFEIPLKMTGVPSMPYPWIDGDYDLYQIQALCKVAASQGLYFHPYHNWFISNSMNDADMDVVLGLSQKTFEVFSDSFSISER